jgi:hypothetical protein
MKEHTAMEDTFSVQSVPGDIQWELQLSEVRSWHWEWFGNPEEGEHPPLEAATKHWLVKTEKTLCVL